MEKIKTILIIGGSGGIGLSAVRQFLSSGDCVFATYNSNAAPLHALKTGTKNLIAVHLDLNDGKEMADFFSKQFKDNILFDAIIYAPASQIKPASLFRTDAADFSAQINLQAKGFLSLLKNLEPQIKEHPLKIIVLATEYCIGKPPSGLGSYVASKYALLGLAKTAAVELSKYGCTVNIVSPGMTRTELLENLPPKLLELTAEQNPLKKLADPDDVANVLFFLASDKSAYLNGTNITVNGGAVML